ncbi:hypothetical protein [Metabacillus sp. 84]|uniref:hypothetical protein n=1 Tax=unclassified Metabacillus TaxID=2675274 RepID=UPI003CF73949
MLMDLDFLNDVSHFIMLISLIVSAGGALALTFAAGKNVHAGLPFKDGFTPAVSDRKPPRLFTGGQDKVHAWIINVMKMAAAPDDDGDRRPFSYIPVYPTIRGGHTCQTNHPYSRSLNGLAFS